MTTLAVLGDSYTVGYSADDHPTQGFPAILGNLLGWTVENFGAASTGFLLGSPNTYAARVPALVATAPDVVIVQGTGNDLPGYTDPGWSAAEIAAEAADVFAAILAGLPDVRLIVTFPLLKVRAGVVTPPSDEAYAALRPAMIAVLPTGAEWIDPVLDEWITGTGYLTNPQGDGNADTYLGNDGLHPSTDGHAYIGSRLASELGGRLVLAGIVTEAGQSLKVYA